MKKWKTLSLLLIVPCCLTLLNGCSQKASPENPPVEFFDISGGLEGKGTRIVEWGETATFNNDIYFKVKDGIDAKDLKVEYKYDQENIGKIQDLNIVVEYDGQKYTKTYSVLVDDTHAPEITFHGKGKVMAKEAYDIHQDLTVIDKSSNQKKGITYNDMLTKFYPGYIVVYAPASDETKVKEALQATSSNELDMNQLGEYKVVVRASDGHGNITNKVIDLEVVDKLLYD